MIGLFVEDVLAGSEAVCPGVGDASTGLDAAGLEVGDASVGLDMTGLDEEADVSEVEGVGDSLQPTSTISKPVSNHRVFTFRLNPPLPLLYQNLELKVPVGTVYDGRAW